MCGESLRSRWLLGAVALAAVCAGGFWIAVMSVSETAGGWVYGGIAAVAVGALVGDAGALGVRARAGGGSLMAVCGVVIVVFAVLSILSAR